MVYKGILSMLIEINGMWYEWNRVILLRLCEFIIILWEYIYKRWIICKI